jgi:isopenicillin-N N-acyltransferase-like protein
MDAIFEANRNIINVLELSGNSFEIGYQYGSKCRSIINKLIKRHYEYYNDYVNISKERLISRIKEYIPYIEEYSTEIMEEILGISKGSNVKEEEIVMLIACLELLYSEYRGCTSFAVTGEATLNGETYIGQTSDDYVNLWFDGDASVLLNLCHESGLRSIIYTYAGIPAMMGTNSNGIALATNGLISEESRLGVPSYILSKEILRQKTIKEAIEVIKKAERAESQNYLLASDKGEIYNIEATPSKLDVTNVRTQIAHTNHFISEKLAIKKDYMAESLSSTNSRYNRINELLQQKYGTIDINSLKEFTKDHSNYPDSICNHINFDYSLEKRLRTLDAMIFVPAKGEAWISHGNPCQSQFKKYVFRDCL